MEGRVSRNADSPPLNYTYALNRHPWDHKLNVCGRWISALKPRNPWYYRRITYNSWSRRLKYFFSQPQKMLPNQDFLSWSQINNMNDSEGYELIPGYIHISDWDKIGPLTQKFLERISPLFPPFFYFHFHSFLPAV